MPNVEKITKQTENPFVNLYLVEGTNKVNHHFRYYVASRAKSIEQMKLFWCASTAFLLTTTSMNSRQGW